MPGTGQLSEAQQSFFVFVRDNNTGKVTSVAIPGDVQIGLASNPADLTLLGRFSVNSTSYIVNSVNKGVLQTSPDDTIIGVSLGTTPISGRISLYLSQSPREGELHFIKDVTGTSDVVPIDIYPTEGYTIDDMDKVTLADPSASLAVVFMGGNWYRLVAGLGASGGGGASSSDTFVTIGSNVDLPNERHLTGSTNILMTDHGAKATVSFDLSQILGPGAGSFTYATVTADAWGRITGISNGTTPVQSVTGSKGVLIGGSSTSPTFSVDPTFFVGAGSVTLSTAADGNLVISGSSSGNITGSTGVLVNSSGNPTTISIDPTFFVGQGSISVSLQGNNLVISGSQGANKFASYLLVNPDAEDTNARTVAAGTGISFVDGGAASNFTVSVNTNTVAMVSGTTFTGPIKAPSITASLGIIAQGTATGGGFSGSLQLLADGHTPYLVGIGAVTVTTSSSGQVIISGSGGSGGSTSASIGANLFASYLLVNPDAQDTNARTVSAGSGISFSDGGPGGLFTISSTGGSSNIPSALSASSYDGYCTGSLTWVTASAWTSALNVPHNFFDVIQQGITRSGSTFTVGTSGYYLWRSSFNFYANQGYIAFRLSGSSGPIIQRTVFDDNTADADAQLDGIFFMNSGSSFVFQYATSGTAGASWNPTDPIGTAPDTMNMRTGHIECFLIANPVTLNVTQQISASVSSWVTVVDIPFYLQTNQTFTGNSSVVIDGYPFTFINPTAASTASVVNGTGVQFTNSATDDTFGALTAPTLTTPLTNLFSSYTLADHDVRLWFWLNAETSTTNFDGSFVGIARAGSISGTLSTENIVLKRGTFAAGNAAAIQSQINLTGSNIFNQNPADTNNTNHNILVIDFARGGRTFTMWTVSGSKDVWPVDNQLYFRGKGDIVLGSEFFSQPPISSSSDVAMMWGVVSTGGRAIVDSLRRFRLDYLNPSVIATGPAAPLNVVTASLTSSITIPQVPSYIQLCGITSSWTDVAFWGKWAGSSTGGNTVAVSLLVDGKPSPAWNTFTEVGTSGDGFGGSFSGYVSSLSSGSHTYELVAGAGGSNLPTINPGTQVTLGTMSIQYQGATLMLMNLTGSGVSAGGIVSGTIYADDFTSYAVVSGSSNKPTTARVLSAGTGIALVDNGPGNTLVISTAGASSSSIGANLFASYLLVNPDAQDANARTIVAGSGISVTDGGPGGSFTIAATGGGGSSFTGSFSGSFTGSLTQLGIPGNPYIVGIGSINVMTNSIGQVILSSSRYTLPDSFTQLHYTLDEVTGSSFTWANSGLAGSLNMTPGGNDVNYGVPGILNNCISFSVAAEGIQTADTSVGETTGPWTLSGWIYPRNLGATTFAQFFGKEYRTGATWSSPFVSCGMQFTNANTGQWQAVNSLSGSANVIVVSTNEGLIVANQWQFLALTFDSINLVAYRNGYAVGALVNNASPQQTDWGTHGRWFIGGHANGGTGESLNGMIDDVRFEWVCRSQTYLAAQFQKGLYGSQN